MDTKGLQKEFLSWCKSKNKSPKTEDETKQLFVAFMKEKHPEEYKQAVQNQQKQQQAQAQKAAHGAKLNYFKSLKNQCAEDEEVVYYKKGGSVTCGCKKKEDGGKVASAKTGTSIIDKFKNRVKDKFKEAENKLDQAKARANYKPDYSSKKVKASQDDYEKGKTNEASAVNGKKCGGKVKKHQNGSVIAQFKADRKMKRISF